MDINAALNKLAAKMDTDYVDRAVMVGSSFVFFGEFLQPILVNDDQVRGLNPNIKEDRDILNAAEKKLKEGDFY